MDNPNIKGKITEAQVLQFVLSKGYSVSIPFGDKDKYDQIWDINGKLLRIQVKTCHLEGDSIEISCKSVVNGHTKRYQKQNIDYFATYWNNMVYVIPVEQCSLSKKLRFKAERYMPHINWASDYEFDKLISTI